LLEDRLVHSPSQFLLDGLELGPHSVAPGFPHDEELALTVVRADKGEAQEVEGLRLAKPTPRAPVRGKAADSMSRVFSGCGVSRTI
jgi:hypothetical protein